MNKFINSSFQKGEPPRYCLRKSHLPHLASFSWCCDTNIDTLQVSSKQIQLNTIKPFQPHYNCHSEDCRLNFQLPCHLALPWRSRKRHPCLPKWSLAQSINPMERMPQKGLKLEYLTKEPLIMILVAFKTLAKMGQYSCSMKTCNISLSLSLSLSVYLYIHVSIYLSISLSTSLSFCLLIHLSIHPAYISVLWQTNNWYQLIGLHWKCSG